MKLDRILITLLFGAALLAACQPPPAPSPAVPPVAALPTLAGTPAVPTATLAFTQPPEPAPTSTAVPSLTPTPPATATPAVTATPVPWSGYPGPTITPPTPVPPPAETLALPPEIAVYVLLGADAEGNTRGRTDSIILVLLNRQTNNVSLVSIPRDLLVYQPGRTMDRINTAYVWGGFDLLALTLEYNLGVRPSHWALVHLNDFVSFVDELGGLDVPVSDVLPDDCDGIPGGIVHMSGRVALCYVRERNTTGEFARSRRQQEVLFVILHQVLSLDSLGMIPEWYERYRGAIQSNFSIDEVLGLIPAALNVHSSGLNSLQITMNETSFWNIPETGASVLLPDRAKVNSVLQQAVAALLIPPAEAAAAATPAP